MLTITNCDFIGYSADHTGPIASFHVPSGYKHAIEALSGPLHLTIGTARKHRTSSQNSAGHAWSREIAEQLGDDYSADDVYSAMKRMAVAEGYPTRLNPIDGKEEPCSSAEVSTEQYAILLRVIQLYADTHSLYLTERVDGKPVKCVGGVDKSASSAIL